MLVGQERSGKTSLKRSLKGERFDSQELSTVGIEVDPLHFQVTTEMWTSGEIKSRRKSLSYHFL